MITIEEMKEMLEEPIGKYRPKFKLCSKCDNPGSIKHAGLLCDRCGGEFIDRTSWTVGNVISRVNPHVGPGNRPWALSVQTAYYLSYKQNISWYDAYKKAIKNIKELKDLYNKIQNNYEKIQSF